LNKFDDYGGIQKFEKTLAEKLGVQQKYVEVQDLRAGSVILDYDIISDKNSELTIEKMK